MNDVGSLWRHFDHFDSDDLFGASIEQARPAKTIIVMHCVPCRTGVRIRCLPIAPPYGLVGVQGIQPTAHKTIRSIRLKRGCPHLTNWSVSHRARRAVAVGLWLQAYWYHRMADPKSGHFNKHWTGVFKGFGLNAGWVPPPTHTHIRPPERACAGYTWHCRGAHATHFAGKHAQRNHALLPI